MLPKEPIKNIALVVVVLLTTGIILWSQVAIMRKSQVVEQSTTISPLPSSGVSVLGTAGWKTYRSKKLRFEFKYPNNWKFEEASSSINGLWEIDLLSPFKDQNGIQFDISFSIAPGSGGRSMAGSCPVSIHVLECREERNSLGMFYIRETNTGQLDLEKQVQDNSYFFSPTVYIQMSLVTSGGKGEELKGSDDALGVFNGVVSTFKFTK